MKRNDENRSSFLFSRSANSLLSANNARFMQNQGDPAQPLSIQTMIQSGKRRRLLDILKEAAAILEQDTEDEDSEFKTGPAVPTTATDGIIDTTKDGLIDSTGNSDNPTNKNQSTPSEGNTEATTSQLGDNSTHGISS